MDPAAPTDAPDDGPDPRFPAAPEEAARYALLRRIGPALKHDLVVNLQALAMMSEVLNARLDRAVPDPDQLQKQVARIHRIARDAVEDSLKVASWLAPADDDSTSLRKGLDDCVALVRTNFGFRGFTLRCEATSADMEVSTDRLRHLVLAGLLHLSDRSPGPGELLVSPSIESATAVVRLRRLPPGAQAPAAPPAEALGWRAMALADVQALATGDARVEDGPDELLIRLPRQAPSGALKIAPR